MAQLADMRCNGARETGEPLPCHLGLRSLGGLEFTQGVELCVLETVEPQLL